MHEDVVDDLEGSVRRLLDFCGLEFEPQCVAFHETKRSVRTASSEQVRQGDLPRRARAVEALRRPGSRRCGTRSGDALRPATGTRQETTDGGGPQRTLPVRQRAKVQALLRRARRSLAAAAGRRRRPTCATLAGLLDAGGCARRRSARALLRAQPEAGSLWKILSVAQLRQGKDALPALRRAAELLPEDAEAHGNLGGVLQRARASGRRRW